MNAREPKSDDMGIVYLTMIGLLGAGSWGAWHFAHTDISFLALKWAWNQLAVIDWGLFQGVEAWRSEISNAALRAYDVRLGQLVELLNQVGYLYVWIPLALSIRALLIIRKHPSYITRRNVSVQTLPWIMSAHAPAIIPSLYYGDPTTLLLNCDPPEHRSSVNPEEWVQSHGLLINGRLDKSACRELFIEDLGKPIEDLSQLSPHEKTMFAIFGARLLSDGKDRAEAQHLLDALNRSCHSGRFKGRRGYPNLAITDEAFRRYAGHAEATKWLVRHPYPRTLLHSMHKAAVVTGRLPSSHFRWLKGIDRGLWYALNTTGRKVPFLESAAVFTQALWEEFAFSSGYRLVEPHVDDAVEGLENYLIKIGLMARSLNKEKS